MRSAELRGARLGVVKLSANPGKASPCIKVHYHVQSLLHHHLSLIYNISGMRLAWVWCARRATRHNVTLIRRLASTQAVVQQNQLSKTRNIGIIAHIDAVGTLMLEDGRV